MANAVYPKYKELLLGTQTASSLTAGTVKVALIDTADYTYNTAHDFYDDVSNGWVFAWIAGAIGLIGGFAVAKLFGQ